jgi:hypothetical protein
MDYPNIFLTITPIPLFSVFLWIVLLLSAMYFARKPFQRCMTALGQVVYAALRLASVSVRQAENQLRLRNREVLICAGLEMAERRVEREFDRLGAAFQKDLAAYPQLQRRLSAEIQKMEEDYAKCAEIPQSLPDWVKVIDAIAHIKPSGDRMVVNMLEEIHRTLDEQHHAAVERHRKDVTARHGILSRMVPVWRGLEKNLSRLHNAIAGLNHRSKNIDRYMDTYEKLRRQDSAACRQLTSSAWTQFFISALVLAVAAIGAVVNFNLVALPISESFGGAGYIGAYKTSDVIGMFAVCLEIVAGFFLMDAIRITRLFPIIASLEDQKRRVLQWGLLAFLIAMAGFESFLAFRRGHIAADWQILSQSLAGVETAADSASGISIIGLMVMGFCFPFILTFVAIPFESFLASGRTLLGVAGTGALRALAFGLRLTGNLIQHATCLLVNLYDLIIFPCLWIEGVGLKKLLSVFRHTPAGDAADNRRKNRAVAVGAIDKCPEP